MNRLYCLLFTAIVAFPAVAGAAIEVTARFDPARVALGEPVRYIVELTETTGGAMPNPERIGHLPIPKTGTLSLSNGKISSGQQTSILNGTTEHRSTQRMVFDVVPRSEGQHVIPSYPLQYKGSRITVPEASLVVLERGANAGLAVDELIFLRADLPDALYVGQSVEVPLTLFVSEQVSLQDLGNFEREGDGFSVSELPPEARRGSVIENGRRYATFRWPMKVTPLTAGEQALGFRFGVVARLPGRSGTDARSRDPLRGRGMFDAFFVQPQRFNLYTPDKVLDVLPLPEEDRPASFTGGIGDFGLKVSVDREDTVEGEPVMLSVVVSGSGNFERLSQPLLPESDDWRVYPPEEHFEPSDSLGLQGSKRFDRVLLPNRAGNLEIPGVRFSFFDPEAEAYVELSSPPLQLAVARANRVPYAAAPQAPPPGSPTGRPSFGTENTFSHPTDGLLALDYGQRLARIPKASALGSPWFYAGNASALILIGVSGFLLRRRHRQASDPACALRAQAARQLKRARREAAERAAAGDAPGFYTAAQSALRLAATNRLGRPLHAACNTELASILSALGLDETIQSAFTELACESDDCRFCGADSSPVDLLQSRKQLDAILRALQTKAVRANRLAQ